MKKKSLKERKLKRYFYRLTKRFSNKKENKNNIFKD